MVLWILASRIIQEHACNCSAVIQRRGPFAAIPCSHLSKYRTYPDYVKYAPQLLNFLKSKTASAIH